MDGWITIGTKLDTSQFDRQASDLEKKIENEEKKQELLNRETMQYEAQLAKATQRVDELAREYDKAKAKAEELNNTINQMQKQGAGAKILQPQMDLERQKQIMQDLADQIEKAAMKQTNLQDKVEKSRLKFENSVSAVEKLKNKINESANKAKKLQFKEAEKSVENIKKGLTGAVGQLGKMALAVLSIRSAYMLVRQASSTLAQYNKQYATDLEYIRFVIAQGLAPVLEKVVELAQTLMAYVNYLVQKLFGVNLFAKGSAEEFQKAKDSMNGIAKSSKEAKNNIASFDQIDVLSQNTGAAGGGGALAPSIDIGGLKDVEIPKWLERIGNGLEKLNKFKLKIDTEPFERFKESLKELEEPLKNWITGDLQTLMEEKAKTTKEIAEGLSKDMSMIGDTFLNRVLAPFAQTAVKYILPVSTKVQIETEKTVRDLFNTLNNEFTRFWTNVVNPAVDLIMHIWDGMWQEISKAWDKWGEPIFEKLREAIQGIDELWQSMWDNFLKPVFDNFFAALTKLWDEHLQPLWANLLEFFGVLTNGILDLWNKTFQPFFTWLSETFGPWLSSFINMVGNVTGELLGGIIDSINGIITAFQGVIEFLVGIGTNDWDRAWNGLELIVKGVINSIIGLINGMIGAIETALNWIADRVNDLNLQVPFSDETIYIKHFHFNRIPTLAKGGIVARPTQAVIGEAGREAVMPLENNTEWMDILADKLGGANSNITIRFTGSTAQLVRLLKPELEKEDKRTGKRLIMGGAY